MSRPKRPWFRFYVEATHDMKIRVLSPTQRWLWVAVLSAARESPLPGVLMAGEHMVITDSMLSDYSDVRLSDVRKGLAKLDELGMIGRESIEDPWRVVRWSERQYESDDVAKRTAKHRSKERSNVVPEPRPATILGTPPETETDSETEQKDSLRSSSSPAAERVGKGGRRDELFEALVEVCRINAAEITPKLRGQLNNALRDLRGVGATAEEIRKRAREYQRKMPGAILTSSALAKHWATLGGTSAPPAGPAMRTDAQREADTRRAMQLAGIEDDSDGARPPEPAAPEPDGPPASRVLPTEGLQSVRRRLVGVNGEGDDQGSSGSELAAPTPEAEPVAGKSRGEACPGCGQFHPECPGKRVAS